VMDSDGSNLKNVTNNPARDFEPSWSPDSKRIVFVSDRDGNMEIYCMNADGSNLKNLTNNPELDLCPSWSSSGEGERLFLSPRSLFIILIAILVIISVILFSRQKEE
ncbi:MAG: PD40 domain-containing protein, partial [Theionarchaea archaeon]|nr:PD40 domain-containing protein [Theionarchaea archaeon]